MRAKPASLLSLRGGGKGEGGGKGDCSYCVLFSMSILPGGLRLLVFSGPKVSLTVRTEGCRGGRRGGVGQRLFDGVELAFVSVLAVRTPFFCYRSPACIGLL